MNIEKLVKYSLPVFVIAIISRAIEAISFFYYAVPVMCVLFIVAMLRSLPRIHFGVKGQKLKVNWKKDKVDTSTSLSVTNNSNYYAHFKSTIINHPASGIKHLFSAGGGFPQFQWCRHFVLLLPGLWFLLTSFWSSYPVISAERALYFILLSAGCLTAGNLWQRYSNKGFLDFLLPANILVVMVCLLSLITNIPTNSWTGGNGKGFMGFFGQQNLLASIILFTLPAVIFRIAILAKLRIQNPHSSITKFIAYCSLLTANLLLLILTYSRASILSLLFGVSIYLILNKKWKIIFYTFSASALIAFIIYITPSLNNLTKNIINKDFPEFYTSRMWMWEPSYRAALDGGLIGLGYGISDPNEKVGGAGDHFEGERFIREKGNSTLALMEEAGLIGLILFLIPIFLLLFKSGDARYLMPDENNLSGIWYPESGIHHPASLTSLHYAEASSILIAALAAFLLHAQFEGWWVGVGSVQLPLFCAYIGLFTGYLQIRFK